ncbi:MAG TPA: HlyD family efflux transporter periplasmic adaptor subunit [Candidatus Hydrogenedentes bacterium]|nr:HlyD family efflux transporter periplasmic adaptor subunit [Candidatus Hydrogenedentota bacterium]
MRKFFGLKSLLAISAVAILAIIVFFATGKEVKEYTTFAVKQGPLDIKVLEGGEVQALESQEVKSRVRGYPGTKILSIVEEGIYITEEDVKNKKVLVELDSSGIIEKLTTSQISFKGTQATYTEALKGLDIQINKSQSEIYASELEKKFARLEMEKYLGTVVTETVLDLISTDDEIIAPTQTEVPEDIPAPKIIDPKEYQGDAPPAPVAPIEEPEPLTIEDLRLGHPDIIFSEFVEKELLGNGGANQELSKLISAFKLAGEDLEKAKNDRDGKQKLYDKKFITEQEMKSYNIAVERNEASEDASEKALQIFIDYEFPKQAEKLMSDFIQARRKLQRTEQLALSQIAQAKAKMASAQARYKIEQKRISDYEEQVEFCVMVAERAGLVVYGGDDRYWNEEPIKEGATIRERQAIITIPDMTTMAVKVNIHESDIKKVTVGLRARIRMDAFPDQKLEGEVTKVAVLPNAENRWMNPDLKVYETTIRIDGVYEWLKPGMSAEAEILIKRLDETLYIPLQSVVPRGKELVCFVIENGVPVPRTIEPGDITIEYITVLSGLKKGEQVLIRPPEGSRKDDTEEDSEESFESDIEEGSDSTSEERSEVVTDENSTPKAEEESNSPPETPPAPKQTDSRDVTGTSEKIEV